MAPTSRRRVLPRETLAASFGAEPLHPHEITCQENEDCSGDGGTSKPSDDNILPNGIQIGRWKITTQNSAIGDEKSMEELTVLLEETANDPDVCMAGQGEDTGRRRRRLCPPEITFLDAIISLQYRNENISSGLVDDDTSEVMREILFTARDALLEWAEAHMYLEMEKRETSSSQDEYRGVTILRTVDAKIWSSKPQTLDAPVTTTSSSSSEFYYDWTFSSPYAGTIRLNKSTGDSLDGGINNRRRWQTLSQSHIPFHMLQDTSQPILLYDDIHLYEDDLHDNGDVSLNIKIRVMPKCWYVLQRLFVRVDHVCIKCREVRYFCLFDDSVGSGSNEQGDVQVNAIYRDVVWREASWEELGRLSLPTDPAAWREDGNVGGTVSGMPAPPPLASLLTRLPSVVLPEDLFRFSCFNVAKV